MTSHYAQDFGVSMGPPPYSKHKETGDSSSYSDVDDKTILTGKASEEIPKFVKKWFQLKKTHKDKLRELKNSWIASQNADGKQNPEKDLEGLKTILPKYAAKWFVLPHEEKEKYRAMKNQTKFGDGIPGFAQKWFTLPNGQKEEFRQMKRLAKTTGKQVSSSSDTDQSDFEADCQKMGVPKFAAKWFALPKKQKQELRIRYRHSQTCKQPACRGLSSMMNMLYLQNQAAYPIYPHMMQAYGGQPMPWMGPYFYPSQQAMCAPSTVMASTPCMSQLPFCLMKQYSPEQKQVKCASKSSCDSDQSQSSCDESPRCNSNEMPMFVKKWFALPNESRQQLRMLKQYKKKHGKPAPAADGIPPFAKKWFGLPEKQKQHWRQVNRSQKQPKIQVEEQCHSQPTASPRDVHLNMPNPANTAYTTIPDFAEKWFSLPTPRKNHLRLLSKYLQSSDKGSDTSGDEYTETMPPFAAKWFSLTSQERDQLRQLKHQSGFKSKSKVRDEGWYNYLENQSGPAPQTCPWQPWAYYGVQSSTDPTKPQH